MHDLKPLEKTQAIEILAKTGIEGEVISIISGAINDVIILTHNNSKKVLRCRKRENIFGYEKDFFKEPIIAQFINQAKTQNSAHNEALLRQIIEKVLSNPCAKNLIASDLLPQTSYYDHSRKKLPCLWMEQEFKDGHPLLDCADNEKWCELGQKIGRLHALQLNLGGPLDKRTQSPAIKIASIIDYINNNLPLEINRKFNLQEMSAGKLSLCHGDLHANNIIAGADKSLYIIDWDNSTVNFPEVDLVKPFYWCSLDDNGFFTPNNDFYNSYVTGYKQYAVQEINAERFNLYKLFWLCKVYNFEKLRENAGHVPTAPYPPAKKYLEYIKVLLEESFN